MTAQATETSTIVTVNDVRLILVTKEFDNGHIVRHYTDGFYTLAVADSDDYAMLARNDNDPSSFLPEIYLDYRDRKSVTIQTTSYGTLSPEKIEEVMEGYTRAKFAASWVTSVLS